MIHKLWTWSATLRSKAGPLRCNPLQSAPDGLKLGARLAENNATPISQGGAKPAKLRKRNVWLLVVPHQCPAHHLVKPPCRLREREIVQPSCVPLKFGSNE